MMEILNQNFIATAWSDLDYSNGDLVDISSEEGKNFTEKGEWLKLCRSVNSETIRTQGIFFVSNEPIIVFIRTASSVNLHKIFNQAWCMARPRLLFLETQTELTLFDLATPPAKDDKELYDKALETVKTLLEVKTKLSKYTREQIESGRTFEDEKFSSIDNRADQSLIRDLKYVRNKLSKEGLSKGKLKYAHSLIGKSIFIRYLEERGILSKEYFLKVAGSNKTWQKLLDGALAKPFANSMFSDLKYPRVLQNKKFTYALFTQISKDFNGDIFPTDEEEQSQVTEEHLQILSKFLNGDTEGQPSLFFWAYRFDIIPIELISNIYEEFYHHETSEGRTVDTGRKTDDRGTYYTPATLVEFVLRRTLTAEILSRHPVVLDPACGSGIFLVETFKRLVRYELFRKQKKQLTYNELLLILKTQIRGIELNEEAIKITAFSLYLAFLDYQSPPDILLQIQKGKRLPHLIFTKTKKSDEQYLDILLQSNAFTVDSIGAHEALLKFGTMSVDVVVGNPPWGSPAKNDVEGRRILDAALQWCEMKRRPTSDKERSQAFIWLAIDLLKPGGLVGMLVSSGILLKQSEKSNIFKSEWINSISIKEIVNFVHVRDIFFNGAISPFISVIFENTENDDHNFIDYWTARRTKILENTKSVILDKTDFKFFSSSETRTSDIWKIFYFGNHRDLSLISKLRLYSRLFEFEYTPDDEQPRRQGFIEGNKKLHADWLKDYKELPAHFFDDRYSSIPFNRALREVPNKVKERGVEHIFSGTRLLIGKVSQKTIPKGQLIVRLETRRFSFRNTITCVKLADEFSDDYKTILGILWSSLARYYFFMTASKWGVWHDQVYTDEILNLPISLPESTQAKERIAEIVDQLRNNEFDLPQKNQGAQQSLFASTSTANKKYGKTQMQLERDLDKQIFKLYKLTPGEIDLIYDRCTYDIDFFYNDAKSIAVSKLNNLTSFSGDAATFNLKRNNENRIETYIKTFLDLWDQEIFETVPVNFKVIFPDGSPLIAVIFEFYEVQSKPVISNDINREWKDALSLLDKELTRRVSQNIYIDGIARTFSDQRITIIKRNEQRLWTRTSAREDIDAAIVQLILKNEKQNA